MHQAAKQVLPLASVSVSLCLRGEQKVHYSRPAWAVLIVTVIMTPVNFAILLPKLGVGPGAFMRCVWRPVMASAAMFGLVAEIDVFLRFIDVQHPAITLAAGILAGVGGYAILILLLWVIAGRPFGAESLLWNMALSRLGGASKIRS